MKTRIITGSAILLAVALMFVSRLLSLYIFDVFITICGVVACIEIATTLTKANKPVNSIVACSMPVVLFLFFIIGILTCNTLAYYLISLSCVVVAYFILVFCLTLFMNAKTKNEMILTRYKKNIYCYSAIKALRSVFVLFYPAILFLSFCLINHFAEFINVAKESVYGVNLFVTFMLLFVFISTMFTDTFALVVGTLFKGPKLCPKVSPNKTISGAIGGVVFSLVGTFILFLIFNTNDSFSLAYETYATFSVWVLIIMALVGSVIAQAGDILASYFKRKANIKDYGSFLPGHGGIMDRLDGMCCNAFFTFVLMCIIML